MNEKIPFLNHVAYQMRKWSIKMTSKAGSGHVTSALSAADIVAALFFDVMQYNPDDFANPNNDRFILSKGHAVPIVYAAWHELGKVSDAELLSYRDFTSALEGHPTFRFAYTEAATGSLGIGLSIGAGQALAAHQTDRDYRTFVLMGDSEVSEGSVWEAAQLADYYKLNNLIGIIDCNRLGQSTATMEALEGDAPERFARMFAAFGWKTHCVDGHDMKALTNVLQEARTERDAPVMIVASTKKGYGVELFEDKEGFHGKALSAEDEAKALKQLQARFVARSIPSTGSGRTGDKEFSAHSIPSSEKLHDMATFVQNIKERFLKATSSVRPEPVEGNEHITLPAPAYKKGQEIATRKVYGEALVELGKLNDAIVSLDAEVKNSTYAELFEKAFPDRFYQCFIAEQNMVGMAIGMDRRNLVPFVSTFASFFSRAFDQLRMAAIGQATLKLAGSHAGVSIGQDGPSQMGLEDIAMMRALPQSIVLYPSDAVSAYKLMQEMAHYNDGISYLRTTRMATPVLYDADESFAIGGCKIVRQSDMDKAVVIGAGVTLHEALKAYNLLKSDGIHVTVIDLYSVKPLDRETVIAAAQKAGKRIVTVEDHYQAGGIGQAIAAELSTEDIYVHQLAVQKLSRSGKPEELLADAGIDAAAIVRKVKAIV